MADTQEPEPEPQKNSEEPEPAPAPEPAPKKKRVVVKMTDKQKIDLKKHMDKHKDLKDLDVASRKSHRMKMMSKMRQGKSLKEAHKEIMSA